VSNVDSTAEKGVERIELVDCGAASEVTKGSYVGVEPEGTPLPFAWVLYS
jgi:hypothetical protein